MLLVSGVAVHAVHALLIEHVMRLIRIACRTSIEQAMTLTVECQVGVGSPPVRSLAQCLLSGLLCCFRFFWMLTIGSGAVGLASSCFTVINLLLSSFTDKSFVSFGRHGGARDRLR